MENPFKRKEELEDYFGESDILVLAENFHGNHDDEILKILDQTMSHIEGVFIELPIDYQASIDLYMSEGRIDETLERHFQGSLAEGKDVSGILKILDKLKINNKKAICIDSSKVKNDKYKTKSEHGYYFLKGESRDEDMFSVINEHYQKKPGKYLVIVGGAHADLGRHFKTNKDTLGTRLSNEFSNKYKSINLKWFLDKLGSGTILSK